MRKGFTLIELLVVIAIIAILAAILFPVFAKARETARTTKCLSHGRQIGSACLMYMDDYSGRFPSGLKKSVADTLPTWNYTWAKEVSVGYGSSFPYRCYYLKKYVKNDDIWLCPSPGTNYTRRYMLKYRSNWLPRNSDDFVNGDRGFQIEASRIGVNEDVNGDGRIDSGDVVGLTVAEVQANDAKGETSCGKRYMPSAKKIMWMCYALGEWGQGRVGTPADGYTFPSYTHKNGTNYVYADGHASWQRMGTAWAPAGYTKLAIDNPSRAEDSAR